MQDRIPGPSSRPRARSLFAATRELQRVSRALRRAGLEPRREAAAGEAAELRLLLGARKAALARFGAGMSDIAWLLLAEACLARLEGRAAELGRLGAAAGVSRSTAHRWGRWLIAEGLLEIEPGRKRPLRVRPSDAAARTVAACLAGGRSLSPA